VIEVVFSKIVSTATSRSLKTLKRKIRITIINQHIEKSKELLGQAGLDFTIQHNKLDHKGKVALAQAITTEAKKRKNL